MRASAHSADAMCTCCSSRRCDPASSRAASAGPFARSTAPRCARPQRRCSASMTSAPCARPSARRRRRCARCARSRIERRGAYWRFDFDANAFLHHMVRNIMGCLVAVGTGNRDPAWLDGRGRIARPQPCGTDLRPRRPLLRRSVLRCRPCDSRTYRGHRLVAWRRLRTRPARRRGADEQPHPDQDLRRLARGRRGGRGRGRRRCRRLRLLSAEPAPRERSSAPPQLAREPAAVRRRRSASSSMRRRPTSSPRPCAIPQLLLQFHGDEGPEFCATLPPALPEGRADGAGSRFARLCAAVQRRPGPAARRARRWLRRRRKGLRLVARSSRRAPSGRFVWWVACRKCHSRAFSTCGPGPLT